MNIGFYLPSLSKHDQLYQISEAVDKYIGTNKLSDASIFYDNIGPNPFHIKCGIFNSTDLWNFKGKLITTSLSSTIKAIKIVNKIELFYYYGWEENINPLSLIHLLSNNVNIISKTDDNDKDLFRKTAYKSRDICNNFLNIIEKLW